MTNDRADRALASDGVSRYGAYLRQRRRAFFPDGLDCPPTADPIDFAVTAWTIASAPIMAPAYAIPHPRIQDATAHWDDDHRAALAVQIAVPPPPIANRLPSRWCGWDQRDQPRRWLDPYDNDRVTVLTILTVRVPLTPTRLPTPRYRSGVPNTSVAKRAVAALCQDLNTELDVLLNALDTPAHRMRTSVATT